MENGRRLLADHSSAVLRQLPAQADQEEQLANSMVEHLFRTTGPCPGGKTQQQVRAWIKKFILDDKIDRSSDRKLSKNLDLAPNDAVLGLRSRIGKMWNDSLFLQPSRYKEAYKNVHLLAEGGFGFVCRVRSAVDGRNYALKIVPFSYKTQKEYDEVIREAQLFASLSSHPNVVGYKTSFLENCVLKQKSRSSRQNSKGECSAESELNSMTGASSYFADSIASSLNSTSMMDSFTRSSDENPRNYNVKFGATLYIQMELCRGSLKAWFRKRREEVKRNIRMDKRNNLVQPLVSFIRQLAPVCEAYFREILSGIKFIHESNLIHRDLKPHNIFFDAGGHLKIGDFGLATIDGNRDENGVALGNPNSRAPNKAAKRTKDIGTVGYAAPEQRTSTVYDKKVDIYSLGIILLELFYPFLTDMERARSLDELKAKRCVPEDLKQEFPLVADMVLKMTSLNPRTRPDASEILISQLCKTEENQLESLQLRVEHLESTVTAKDVQIAQLRRALNGNRNRLNRLRRSVKAQQT